MNIYTVEIEGKFLKYIGISRAKSEAAAAVNVTASIFEERSELGHDVSLRVISKHRNLTEAKRHCKRKFPDHEEASPYWEFLE